VYHCYSYTLSPLRSGCSPTDRLTKWLTEWLRETMAEIALGPGLHCPYASCSSHAAATETEPARERERVREIGQRGEQKHLHWFVWIYTWPRGHFYFSFIFDVAGLPFDVCPSSWYLIKTQNWHQIYGPCQGCNLFGWHFLVIVATFFQKSILLLPYSLYSPSCTAVKP